MYIYWDVIGLIVWLFALWFDEWKCLEMPDMKLSDFYKILIVWVLLLTWTITQATWKRLGMSQPPLDLQQRTSGLVLSTLILCQRFSSITMLTSIYDVVEDYDDDLIWGQYLLMIFADDIGHWLMTLADDICRWYLLMMRINSARPPRTWEWSRAAKFIWTTSGYWWSIQWLRSL